MSERGFIWPVAASTFAGLLGAGVVDGGLIVARADAAAPLASLALPVGLYGTAGLVLGALAGWAAGVALGASRSGGRPLAQDRARDELAAGAILAGLFGAVVLAVLVAGAHGAFVGKMASKTLAVIATAGVVLLLSPAAVIAALAVRRPARAVARAMPGGARLPRTALLLGLLSALGVLAGVAALSRADWRVLDLGPLKVLAVAILLGGAHGWFWYGSRAGRALHGRLPVRAIRAAAAVAAIVALFVAAGLPESSPAIRGAVDHGWGLRLGLGVARSVTDGDGDGFSARFGGGDCDESRSDTFPGGDDVPGDGIDQNCEGGDAKAATSAAPAAAEAEPAKPVKAAAGAFAGNILVISIDALRADRLGVAGYGRPQGRSLTPNLDALAKRGAYFRRAWSHAPNTPRSFPASLTSRYPSEIAWQQRTSNYSPILPSNETFFEQLARGGWKPIGIFSHFYFTAERGLSQGFAEWSNEGAGTIAESNKDIASPRIVPKVIDRLRRAAAANERFAIWTHLFEPHSSYMEHKEYPTSLRGVAGLEEKYDFEIAYVDGWVGKLLAALEETGLAKNTAVVIIADHGEAWGEHKFYFHGQDLTEEQLRVPFIVAVPGKAPQAIDDEVALIDLGPTLLDLVGLPIPASFRGRSLLPRIEGQPLPPRPVFAELLPASSWPKHEVMMVDQGRKLTHKITDRRWELHDLTTDPKQQKNLADSAAHRALFEELKAKLLAFEERPR